MQNSEIHTASPDEGMFDTARVLRLCLPCFDSLGTITFSVEGRPHEAWLLWCGRSFLPALLPTLIDARRHTLEGRLRELVELDRDLSDRLADPIGSLAAGQRLTLDYVAPRIERVLDRYADAVRENGDLGNLAVVYGIRSAIFNVPPRAMIAGYLHAEAFLGTDARYARELPEMQQHGIRLAECHVSSSAVLRAA